MSDTGVIDRFFDTYSAYIDSGFGLLGGEVAFLSTTLVAIDVTLAALFLKGAPPPPAPAAATARPPTAAIPGAPPAARTARGPALSLAAPPPLAAHRQY